MAVIGCWHIRLRKEMQNNSLASLHEEQFAKDTLLLFSRKGNHVLL